MPNLDGTFWESQRSAMLEFRAQSATNSSFKYESLSIIEQCPIIRLCSTAKLLSLMTYYSLINNHAGWFYSLRQLDVRAGISHV